MIPSAASVAIRSERRPNATAVRGAVNASATSKWVRSLHRILRHQKRECKKKVKSSPLRQMRGVPNRCAVPKHFASIGRGNQLLLVRRQMQTQHPTRKFAFGCTSYTTKNEQTNRKKMQMNTVSGQDAFQDTECATNTLLNPCEICSLELLDHAVPCTSKHNASVERRQRTGPAAPNLRAFDTPHHKSDQHIVHAMQKNNDSAR
jgi:hypothetical protein